MNKIFVYIFSYEQINYTKYQKNQYIKIYNKKNTSSVIFML